MQYAEPKLFPGPLLAPFIEVIVHALQRQGVGGQQFTHGQPAPLTAGFKLVKNGPDNFLGLGRPPPALGAKRQMRQYPSGNNIFGQDFYEGGKREGSYLKFRSAVGVFCIIGSLSDFLTSFYILEIYS